MKKYILSITVLIALLVLIPSFASAANVYFETAKNNIAVGDTAIITVKINAEGKTINTVEGNVLLKSSANNAVVQEFSLANSVFGLWPRTPSLSSDGKTVSFVGGVPGGFNIEGATIFKIIVEAKKEGSLTLSSEDFSVFENDGKGTKVSAQSSSLVINVVPKQPGSQVHNEWDEIIAEDKIAPEDFIIILGQDTSLFEGKKFAFFSALDNQSGISHYDVSENNAPAVRSGSTYVLQNQEGKVELDVVAYDKAGNKKSAVYSGSASDDGISWPVIIIIVLIVVIVWLLIKKLRKSKKNASPAI